MNQEIIRRISDWKLGKKPGPYGLELSPTLRCNENCQFCWRRGKDKIDYLVELTLEKYLEIINDAADMDVREIKIIGGGEATIRPEMFKVMELVKKRGMYGYLCTNGTFFNEENIKGLVKAKWDHIKISLHGPDARTHDELTGLKGSYDKVIEAVKLFNKYKKQKWTSLPKIEFGFVMVNKNFMKIPEMIKLAKELGVNYVLIEPITPYSKLGEGLRLSEAERKELGRLATQAEKDAKALGINTNLEKFQTDNLVNSTNKMDKVIFEGEKNDDNSFEGIPCFEPFYRMGIRTDGIVGPCGFLDDDSTESIKNKRLNEVWLGEYMQKMRSSMLSRKLGAQCKRCCTTLVFNNVEIRKALNK